MDILCEGSIDVASLGLLRILSKSPQGFTLLEIMIAAEHDSSYLFFTLRLAQHPQPLEN